MASERTRVSIPQNEYGAALSALTNILSNDGNPPSSPPKHQQQQIKSSILSTIQQYVQPIPSTSFQNMEIFGSTPIKRQLHKALDDSEDISLSSCSTHEFDQIEEEGNDSLDSDVELEEDELLDEGVFLKAKEMRHKVRAASFNLQKMREERMEEALRGVTTEVDDLIRLEKELEQQIESRDGDNDGSGEMKDNVHMTDMKEALFSLKERLEEMDSLLPDKLQGIRDTIESVSHSLRKQRNKEYNATEKAIRSRDGDDAWRRNAVVERNNSTNAVLGMKLIGSQETAEEGGMNAVKRFAMFVYNS